LAVNLIVDFAEGRFAETVSTRALESAAARGYRLQHTTRVDDRLAAWIDWRFAPSWWSSEARAGEVWYACDARGDIAGFAAFDARGLRFPWLRAYERQTDVGIFGPYGVAPEHRKTGLGQALLDLALAGLRHKGYARALIPAVGFERLVTMYQALTGAHVADTYSYTSARRFRTTILASGGGTNAQSVFERAAAGQLPLDFGLLIANVPGVPVIGRAAAAGVAAQTIVWNRTSESRATYDTRLIDAVAGSEPELILLLGWMHLLPPAFIARFPEILNVHPAFLPFDPRADDVMLPDGSVIPAFRGAYPLRDALAANATWLGASVHHVTAEVDRGAIVVRTPLRLDGLTNPPDVIAKLRPIEHAAVAAAIRRWSFEHT
jgi:phosphoribosylglycinamide formyltransferase-1